MAGGNARDMVEGITGALGIAVNLCTPFLRPVRSRWGVSAELAARTYVADNLVPEPAWSWTHAVEIDAPAEKVWPWVAQIGQNKAGFYSYQWLENLVGCRIRNADSIHPEWTVLRVGDGLHLHPTAPPLRIAVVEPGRCFAALGVFDPSTGVAPVAWHPERFVRVSWLFDVEPVSATRSRFVSRYRVTYGRDTLTRLSYGAWPVESIGFVMDRRMLLGVKQRAERAFAQQGPAPKASATAATPPAP